jgi:YVTN family beta-propeller protein
MVSGCKRHDFPEYPANYREFAYVTNGASGTVSVLDVVNVRVDREIQVGQRPIAVVANPKRNEVYVLNAGNAQGDGSISVLDAEKNAVVASIAVRRQPASLEVDADGDFAYVANSGSNSVSVIDLKSYREVAVIGTGEKPAAARISPDGKSLVVTNRAGNSVSILDVGHRQIRKVIENCPGASDVAILPDSSKAFVGCSSGHQILAITLARGNEAGLAQADQLEAVLNVGLAPVHLAMKPDGGELFVSNSESDSVSEVVTSTDDVGGAYLIGSHPVRGLVSKDNSLLYECNYGSQEISIYAIDDGKRAKSIHVGDGPVALAFSTGGHLLFAVDGRSGDVAVIRTSSQSLFNLLAAGREPNAIAIKAFKVL